MIFIKFLIEFLQELSEILCYSFLSSRAFNCLPLRCLIREILANHLVKISIDNLTDPDYINQTILYWVSVFSTIKFDFNYFI